MEGDIAGTTRLELNCPRRKEQTTHREGSIKQMPVVGGEGGTLTRGRITGGGWNMMHRGEEKSTTAVTVVAVVVAAVTSSPSTAEGQLCPIMLDSFVMSSLADKASRHRAEPNVHPTSD